VVSFTPLPIYCWKTVTGTQWIAGCVGSRASLDAVAMSKNLITSPAEIYKILSSFYNFVKTLNIHLIGFYNF
jgi:hypothetical protein